jgi:hypothetical protein
MVTCNFLKLNIGLKIYFYYFSVSNLKKKAESLDSGSKKNFDPLTFSLIYFLSYNFLKFNLGLKVHFHYLLIFNLREERESLDSCSRKIKYLLILILTIKMVHVSVNEFY